MSNALIALTNRLASRFDMGDDGSELVSTLKATAFKGNVSDAQMMALLAVANQYNLNPWTKEIYAFPDKNNGIVPVVGVDGWARIINSNDKFDGMEFDQDEESCTCRIFRKDRSRPVSITEYMAECKRGAGPWQSHPRRMLRHKAMIQCARIAFGYGGIYDQDEAERIVEKDMGRAEIVTDRIAQQLPEYPQDQFINNLPAWRSAIEAGRITAEQIVARASSKYVVTKAQREALTSVATVAEVIAEPAQEQAVSESQQSNGEWLNEYDGEPA